MTESLARPPKHFPTCQELNLMKTIEPIRSSNDPFHTRSSLSAAGCKTIVRG